jgi:hypothetical protein
MSKILANSLICDLFIRSYWKDLDWLQFCLASVERYCRGFREVIVVVPQSTEPWLRRRLLQSTTRIEFCHDYRDDYLGQQVTKLFADTFTDADYICHVDSDCVFSRPTTPLDLVEKGRPRVLIEPCALLGRHRPWQQPTEKFIGYPVFDDFMRQPPFTFPRRLYKEVRQYAVARHGVDIEAYVTGQPPRSFSEFNVLGAFAWQYCHGDFLWIDISVSEPTEPHCRWYWSWGGLDKAVRREIKAILA